MERSKNRTGIRRRVAARVRQCIRRRQPQPRQSRDNDTATPIKHVIVIIGENRSFDHVFATYVPQERRIPCMNLLSEGIIKADGTPGPNFSKAEQNAATDQAPDAISAEPGEIRRSQRDVLPAPLVGGPSQGLPIFPARFR